MDETLKPNAAPHHPLHTMHCTPCTALSAMCSGDRLGPDTYEQRGRERGGREDDGEDGVADLVEPCGGEREDRELDAEPVRVGETPRRLRADERAPDEDDGDPGEDPEHRPAPPDERNDGRHLAREANGEARGLHEPKRKRVSSASRNRSGSLWTRARRFASGPTR